ncbi:uncharacterized protein LOC116105598 [Pistacia vera]|uniref:uncharacterized protein LOC116105598 n=1 Tax=Pistacia vera TaxID=55513 RepID=UPI001263BC55|nr:uncharacterized protein LOC116105598 [Pistacia vera]
MANVPIVSEHLMTFDPHTFTISNSGPGIDTHEVSPNHMPTWFIQNQNPPGIHLEVVLHILPLMFHQKMSIPCTRSKSKAYALLATHGILAEPKSVTKALNTPKWKEAMNVEYQALLNNKTWELVPYEKGMNVVGSKWVFKTKLHFDGSLQKYKARLVAKGFQQTPGLDNFDTFFR